MAVLITNYKIAFTILYPQRKYTCTAMAWSGFVSFCRFSVVWGKYNTKSNKFQFHKNASECFFNTTLYILFRYKSIAWQLKLIFLHSKSIKLKMATENSVLNDTRTPGFICSMKCSWNRFLNSDCSENSSLCTGSNKKWLEGIVFYLWCRKAEDTMKHYLSHRMEHPISASNFTGLSCLKQS